MSPARKLYDYGLLQNKRQRTSTQSSSSLVIDRTSTTSHCSSFVSVSVLPYPPLLLATTLIFLLLGAFYKMQVRQGIQIESGQNEWQSSAGFPPSYSMTKTHFGEALVVWTVGVMDLPDIHCGNLHIPFSLLCLREGSQLEIAIDFVHTLDSFLPEGELTQRRRHVDQKELWQRCTLHNACPVLHRYASAKRLQL